jgi:peptidoglycan/LPS O-acetylase OafA/YrhL
MLDTGAGKIHSQPDPSNAGTKHFLVCIYCALNGVEFSYSKAQTIYSALLVGGWLGYAGVIPVLWTLSAEIMFYVIMAAVAAWLGPKFGYRGIISAVLGCLALVYGGLVLSTSASSWPALAVFARFTSFNAVYIIFMLAGAAVYKGFSVRKAKHSWALIDCALAVAVILAIFALGVILFEHYYPRAIQTDVWTGTFSFLVFVVFLVAGGRLKDWKIPSFFADISYPLYLVHLPLAWIVLYEVTKRDISLHIAVPVAFATIILISWILHKAIEEPFQKLGQNLGRRSRVTKLNANEEVTVVSGASA